LTKVHEEFVRGNLPDVAAQIATGEVRGEVVVCVGGAVDEAGPEGQGSRIEALEHGALERRYEELIAAGTARNAALKQIAAEHGVPRRHVYKMLMIENEEKS